MYEETLTRPEAMVLSSSGCIWVGSCIEQILVSSGKQERHYVVAATWKVHKQAIMISIPSLGKLKDKHMKTAEKGVTGMLQGLVSCKTDKESKVA